MLTQTFPTFSPAAATWAVLAILCGALPASAQDEKIGKKPTAPAPAATAANADPANPSTPAAAESAPGAPKAGRGRMDGGGMVGLFNIVQIGMTHRGIRMPIMEDRKVSTIVTSEVMRRLDEHNIEFEDAVIDQKGKDGMVMTLPKAIYNKQSDQLFSSQPSTVESPEYRIEGDTLSVDRKTNVYLMTGRVRFMFFGASGMDNNKAAAAPATPPAAPNPTQPK